MGVDAQMFVRNRGPRLSAEDIHALSERLRNEARSASEVLARNGEPSLTLTPSVGEYRSWLRANGLEDEEEPNVRGLPDGVQIWVQDGPALTAQPNEQWISVRLFAWYFSPEYLRGPWPAIRSIAAWLEQQIVGSEVWYGGDSSGYLAHHLTRDLRDAYSRAYDANRRRDS